MSYPMSSTSSPELGGDFEHQALLHAFTDDKKIADIESQRNRHTHLDWNGPLRHLRLSRCATFLLGALVALSVLVYASRTSLAGHIADGLFDDVLYGHARASSLDFVDYDAVASVVPVSTAPPEGFGDSVSNGDALSIDATVTSMDPAAASAAAASASAAAASMSAALASELADAAAAAAAEGDAAAKADDLLDAKFPDLEGELEGADMAAADVDLEAWSAEFPSTVLPRNADPLLNDVSLHYSDSYRLRTHRYSYVNDQRDPDEKFLVFENHSGFHNQRSSIIHAVTLARILNRTLLLQPVALGHAQPWANNLMAVEAQNQVCKQICIEYGEQCHERIRKLKMKCRNDPRTWTTVGWDFLVHPEIFRHVRVIDRWNNSEAALYAPISEGGLAIASGPEDVVHFRDTSRATFQITENHAVAPTNVHRYERELPLEDLLAPKIAQKKVLQFGSLFGYARLVLSSHFNEAILRQVSNSFIVENELVGTISSRIRDAIGGHYIGIHLRTGDGSFFKHVEQNMEDLFVRTAVNILKVSEVRAQRMWRESVERADTEAESGADTKKRSVIPSVIEPRGYFSLDPTDDPLVLGEETFAADDNIVEEDAFHAEWESSPLSKRGSIPLVSGDMDEDTPPTRDPIPNYNYWRHNAPKSAQLSPTLRCRRPLYTDPTMIKFNTPLFIATDERSPRTFKYTRAFFDHYPCAFSLSDFAPGEFEGNTDPIEQLGNLNKYTSDFDDSSLGKYLFPFIDLETAAWGRRFIGTPGSTFSQYAKRVLHPKYMKAIEVAQAHHTVVSTAA